MSLPETGQDPVEVPVGRRGNRTGVDESADFDAILDEQRASVLRFIGYVSLVIGLPVMAAVFLAQLWTGKPSWFLAVEFCLTLVLGVILSRTKQDALGLPSSTFIGAFGAICLLAFNGFGPLIGVGMMLFAWLFAAVFLSGRIIVPATLVVGAVLGFGIAATYELTIAPWPLDEDPSFVLREVSTTLVVAVASAFLFQRIFSGLGMAVANESEARQREARATAEREASLEALAEARRLESIGRLAGGVAHDVNNALTVILGNMEFLNEDLDEHERAEMLGDMRAAAEGALATTRQLLGYARKASEPGHGVCSPGASLEALERNLRRLLPEHIAVEVVAGSALPDISVDAGTFEQVVLNLCLNARDAMPEGGRLVIRCDVAGGPNDAEMVEVSVIDQGEGMDATTIERVFDPFFTTKRDAGGTGLGLSMVHSTVTNAGGDVAIESSPGEGTTVRLRLPTATETGRADASSSGRIQGAGRSVLVLEDEPAVKRTVERSLVQAGFVVTTTATVAEALAALETDAFDLLLTDGILPDGDPSPAIARHQARGHGAVVVYSGHLEQSPVLAKVLAGEHEFVRKPASHDDLLRAIERQLHHSLGVSGSAPHSAQLPS